MASVTIRNLPDEVHRAIRMRAAQHGRSVEAEMRQMLEQAVKPEGRLKLGTLLVSAGKALNLSEEEFKAFSSVRDPSPARAASFE